jgi:hypothetical protein
MYKWPSSRMDAKAICEVLIQAAVDWTNSSSEVARAHFSPRKISAPRGASWKLVQSSVKHESMIWVPKR